MSRAEGKKTDFYPQLRQDPVSKIWVIISPGRAARPEEFDQSQIVKRKVVAKKEDCPFCEGNEKRFAPQEHLHYPRKKGKWSVRVIPNKYPALIKQLTINNQSASAKSYGGSTEALSEGGQPTTLYIGKPGYGSHEVIITYDHEDHTPKQPLWLVEDMLRAYQDRILDLKKDKKIKYVHIFVNEGDEAGASIAHPHSQLCALNFVPEIIEKELESTSGYYKRFKKCIFCDIIEKEKAQKKRIILENKHFICFCPYASLWPFEMRILPKKHQASFEDIDINIHKNLAQILKNALYKLDKGLGEPAYNHYLHTAPVNINQQSTTNSKQYHWHIEIFPRINIWAGLEFGTGAIINTMIPEVAAKFLKKVKI